MTLCTPASASSAAVSAQATPPALRLIQGTSTSPAMGSHTSPNWFFSAIAHAWALMSGVPPAISTSAAAAMAAALPHSAWQPPSAPAMDARNAITMPNAPAVNSALTALSSGRSRASIIVKIAPGKMPHEPAVGAATILPIAALYSETAIARVSAPVKNGPHNPPVAAY